MEGVTQRDPQIVNKKSHSLGVAFLIWAGQDVLESNGKCKGRPVPGDSEADEDDEICEVFHSGYLQFDGDDFQGIWID